LSTQTHILGVACINTESILMMKKSSKPVWNRNTCNRRLH